MLMKQCPMCGRVIDIGERYCCSCSMKKKKELAERERNYSGKRSYSHKKFYRSKEWQFLRTKKLSDSNYLCEECKKNGKTTMAMEVHHIVALVDDFSKRLDYNNLLTVCVSCHNKLHNKFGNKK